MENSSNKVVTWVIIALIVGGIAGYYMANNQAPSLPAAPGSSLSQSGLALQNAMRKLWEDHITWTRLYIVEAVAGTKGVNETAARLLKNQDEIGDAIKTYYGNDAGAKLTALLKEHILGAVEVLTAAKAGDKTKLEAASAKWYQNGTEIATFLSGANPQNWPLDDMTAGMKMHLDLTLAEAVAQLEGKYDESIEGYDLVHEHILGLADLLSSGIIAQFPEQF